LDDWSQSNESIESAQKATNIGDGSVNAIAETLTLSEYSILNQMRNVPVDARFQAIAMVTPAQEKTVILFIEFGAA
jgi:hypothetical protein